jgi:hypothetical protein
MMSQRTPWGGPQNLKNNTGFGVIRIQVVLKARARRSPDLTAVPRYDRTGTAVPVPVLINDRQPSPPDLGGIIIFIKIVRLQIKMGQNDVPEKLLLVLVSRHHGYVCIE